MCVLIFSTTFVWTLSHCKKNLARYCRKCRNVFMWSTRYFCRILNTQTDMTKLIVAFRNSAKAPKMNSAVDITMINIIEINQQSLSTQHCSTITQRNIPCWEKITNSRSCVNTQRYPNMSRQHLRWRHRLYKWLLTVSTPNSYSCHKARHSTHDVRCTHCQLSIICSIITVFRSWQSFCCSWTSAPVMEHEILLP